MAAINNGSPLNVQQLLNNIRKLKYDVDPIWKTPKTSSVESNNPSTDTVTATPPIANNPDYDSTMATAFGSIFSNNSLDKYSKMETFLDGMSKDAGSTLVGTASGLAANGIGQGISGIMGNSRLGKGVGQGVATGLGTIGSTIGNNLLNTGKIAGNASKLFGTGKSIWTTKAADGSFAGAINPYALGATVAGTALSAITGPSKEYNGRYGNITKSMDAAYDKLSMAASVIPGYGQAVSGVMALNKGLSNIFGSTDGMSKTDAILGSAFMPAPIKWVNMWGSSKTGTFNNQSWQNSEQANSFMQNGFGNLNDKFQQAMEEAGKRYGTFSHGAKKRAQRNIDFANTAWDQIMDMANQNDYQNIRSQDMSSINNQRYAQMIQGGWNPLYRGKQGMKILNNQINHSVGMRLLSGAALIDNKQIILSRCREVN